jgi:hypothetical protein
MSEVGFTLMEVLVSAEDFTGSSLCRAAGSWPAAGVMCMAIQDSLVQQAFSCGDRYDQFRPIFEESVAWLLALLGNVQQEGRLTEYIHHGVTSSWSVEYQLC